MNNQSPSQHRTAQTRNRKFLRPDATPLTPEAIEEIRNAPENIPNACRVMCKKYHIGTKRYEDIINNRMPSEPTEEWRHIIESSRTTPRHVYICALCDTQPSGSTGSTEIFTKLDTKSEALLHEYERESLDSPLRVTNTDSVVPPPQNEDTSECRE
ncbi:6484_t:CDS:2, partial [Paraglomus occultum]